MEDLDEFPELKKILLDCKGKNRECPNDLLTLAKEVLQGLYFNSFPVGTRLKFEIPIFSSRFSNDYFKAVICEKESEKIIHLVESRFSYFPNSEYNIFYQNKELN
jgi:hypothetical protein